jgi:hypothetical protein
MRVERYTPVWQDAEFPHAFFVILHLLLFFFISDIDLQVLLAEKMYTKANTLNKVVKSTLAKANK